MGKQTNTANELKPNTVSEELLAKAEFVFHSMLRIPEHDRGQYIDKECSEDPALRAEVLAMVSVQRRLGGFVTVPSCSKDIPSSEKEGDFVDRYKLIQQIGEGGFGKVWMAEQIEPITRLVALKVIKAGMDTKEVLDRFEAERQALAMMEHPNIARVLDAGATSTGRPYFVMELVNGIPITKFCDEQALTIKERLPLFKDVCGAINHAHQKGIIHRDIKPSNVMVTLQGNKPIIKIIDFGIAKATQGKLTKNTLHTRFDEFIGTPVYMSPEQISLNRLDIDTRSDIYALGVLLYELLVGTPPFDAQFLASAGHDEMRRIIREDEPLKPSSRISTIRTIRGKERVTIAKDHHIEPKKINRMVDADLDWIVMKAIDKDRSRRYATANAFAEDIRRFLIHEPVTATPPSPSYQFRKFAKRHGRALRVGAGIAAMMVAATMISSWQAVKATRAEQKTADTLTHVAAERDAKEQARHDAELARKDAELARRNAESVTNLFKMVFQNPDLSRYGNETKVVDLLSPAAMSLNVELANQPELQAKLQDIIGSTYRTLGLHEKGYNLQKEALVKEKSILATSRKTLGSDHPKTIMRMIQVADSYRNLGQTNEALALRKEILNLGTKVNGPQRPSTIQAMLDLGIAYQHSGQSDKSIKILREVLKLRRKFNGLNDPDTIEVKRLILKYLQLATRHNIDALPQLADATSNLPGELLGETESQSALLVAALQVWIGDKNGYNSTCQRMHAWAANTKNANYAERAAKIGCLLPVKDSAVQKACLVFAKRAVDLGQPSVRKWPWYYLTLGISEYRNGHYSKAAKALKVASKADGYRQNRTSLDVTAGFYQAMNLLQQGKHAEARIVYLSTEAEMPPLPDNLDNPLVYGADADRIILWLAFKEARLLLRSHGINLTPTIHRAVAIAETGDIDGAVAVFSDALDEARRPKAEQKIIREASGYDAVFAELRKQRPEYKKMYEISAAELLLKDGRVSEAMPMLMESPSIGPEHTVKIMAKAALQAWFGLESEYEGSCQHMLKIAEQTSDPNDLERIAKVICLRPVKDRDRQEATLKIAKMALKTGNNELSWFRYRQMTLGMAEYRAENYARAVKVLGELQINKGHISSTAAYFHAMCFFKQGMTKEALILFKDTQMNMKPLPSNNLNPLAGGFDINDLILWLSYKEARKLITGNNPNH